MAKNLRFTILHEDDLLLASTPEGAVKLMEMEGYDLDSNEYKIVQIVGEIVPPEKRITKIRMFK